MSKESLLTEAHPWTSAVSEFEGSILPRLRKDGKVIGDKAAAGDKDAMEVIRLYTMLRRSFDPVTMILLKDAIGKVKLI